MAMPNFLYWLPVFVAAEPCLIFTESLNYCHQHKSLRINAFVIMPTHAHLIVFDVDFDNELFNKTITAMRQYTGRQLATYCHEKMPAVYGQVIGSPRRQDRANQFWQQSNIRLLFGQRDFGRRSLIICTTIHAAKGWCMKQRIGVFPLPRIGWPHRPAAKRPASGHWA